MNRKTEKVLRGEQGNYIFPFLWMHGEPEETLREYVKVIRDCNIRAFCVESRPHPDFCGEGWWRDMDILLEEAEKRGMQVWILDDSHFPTGYANGAMKDQPDELCRQSICCRIRETGGGLFRMSREEIEHPDPFEKSQVEQYIMEKEPRTFEDDRLLALFAARLDEQGKILRGDCRVDLRPLIGEKGLEWEAPEGRWKVYAVHLSRNHGYHRSYINMMDRNSCRVLLDAVYEPHYRRYSRYFGSVIAGFFSDEPELGNGHMYEMNDPFGSDVDYPWSRELEEELRCRLGEGYGQLLALLWETRADPDITAKVRYAYMDAVTKLVREDFSMQIGEWCRGHGVKYIGHLIEDNNHHTRTGCSLGHYFRGLAGQDMAGIDDIGGQVFPQGEEISYDRGVFARRNGEFYHYILGKLGSSAAAVQPLKNGNSMCEIFGNYGWEEGVRLEKYLADHFLVRGINHFVPHAFSMKDFPDPDCPPHFYAHGHNPQYRHFGWLMAYMNRVCELISGGRHIPCAAVIYHGEGDWTGKCMTDDGIGRCLADAQTEYDLIPQDVFSCREEYRTEMEEGALRVNTQRYRAVIVPYMQYVTEAFAQAVEEMAGHGIPVIFAEGYPEGICDTEVPEPWGAAGEKSGEEQRLIRNMRESGICVKMGDLNRLLREKKIPEISIEPENDRVRYLHYVHNDGMQIWMLVNEGTGMYSGRIHFSDQVQKSMDTERVYEYDAWENRIRPAIWQEGALHLEIEPMKSRIYVYDPLADREEIKAGAELPFMKTELSEQMEFSGVWRRSICDSAAYPFFRKEKEIRLPDALAEEEPEFSGYVRYENRFETEETEGIWLEITDAYEGVEVFVNGRSLGIQIVPVYRFDLSSAVKKGENRICIQVATTLERQMAAIPDRMGNRKTASSPTGITGEVRLWRAKKEGTSGIM